MKLLKRSQVRIGEVITAEVIRAIDHNHVVVNAGLKSESYVPLEEFKNDQGVVEASGRLRVRGPSTPSKTAMATPCSSRDKAKQSAS